MANKAQLIEALSERLGDKKVASEAVDGLVDIIIRTVNKGEKVNITGFGVFEKRARAARTARNPRTGETVRVKKTNVPAFRAGTTFKDVISGAKKLPKATAVKRATSTTSRSAGTTTASRATTTRATGTRATGTRSTATRPTATRSTTTRTRAAAATKTAAAAPKTAAKTTTAKKPAAAKAAPKAAAAKTTATKATAAKKPATSRAKKK
jgi:DNA-binding protein HU-beta